MLFIKQLDDVETTQDGKDWRELAHRQSIDRSDG
jgi:hypothetical protein